MEEHFYIFCIVSLTIVLILSILLAYNIKKEWDLYRLFSTNRDMRTLLAKDPKRFHISIVYLMTYLTRSNNKDKVQKDKLQMIVRYIVEVIPVEYQIDAIKALKYLTNREKEQGRLTFKESIVNVSLFKRGYYQDCIKSGIDSYHFSHDIHGTKMAEELGHYLSEEDKLYIMYLLCRLANLDGVITTNVFDSENSLLEKLCVKGLKIKSSVLLGLINSFRMKSDQQWYDGHFADEDGKYPSSKQLGNVFRVDIEEAASIEKKKLKTSVLPSILVMLYVSIGISFLTTLICSINSGKYINYVYHDLIHWISFIINIVLIPFCMYISFDKLESSIIPILRTEFENTLQKKWLKMITNLGLVSIFLLNFSVINVLVMSGNKVFSSKKDVCSLTVPTTGNDVTHGKNSSTYYVKFKAIDFSKIKIPEKSNEKRISTPNHICLEILRIWSGMSLFGVNHFCKISSTEVDYYDYNTYQGKNIKIYFQNGYYGMIYKTGDYIMTDGATTPNKNVDDDSFDSSRFVN